jgi:putative transposase
MAPAEGGLGGETLMDAVTHLAPTVGVVAACDFLGVARASFYRQRPALGPPAWPAPDPSLPSPRPAPARSLSPAERESVLTALHEERFQDRSPAAVQATLLDEGQYLCSARTMYRILEREGESSERRDQLVHPPYQKPELLATGPNQLWSWDITKLLGPAKWTYFYLYVILDVFSRYVVGWMVAPREAAELAKRFLEETIRKHEVPAGQLNIHADRGRVMTSKPVAFLMADLGVTKTHSRPYVSDDNPYSESQFRTLKYRPEFPDRFGSIQDSRAFCRQFFPWYNQEHRHSGIGLLTPAMVHFGEAETVLAHRQVVLDAAYQAHPDRFVRRPPRPPVLPTEVWINKPVLPGPKTKEESQ